MTAWLLPLVTLATALGCGVLGGVFFAFSNFIMKALSRVPAAEGIRVMQSINVTVLNKWFLGVFLGTAAGCVLTVVLSVAAWHAPSSALRLGGGISYLVGSLGVTRAFNIPRNEVFVRADPDSATAAELWSRYLAEWTAWNHVRAIASVVAAASLTAALMA
jgi:uncharacterized membrane protein